MGRRSQCGIWRGPRDADAEGAGIYTNWLGVTPPWPPRVGDTAVLGRPISALEAEDRMSGLEEDGVLPGAAPARRPSGQPVVAIPGRARLRAPGPGATARRGLSLALGPCAPSLRARDGVGGPAVESR